MVVHSILRTADMLDAGFYQALYPDLAAFSREQAAAHYHEFGRHEGRAYAAGSTRDTLDALLPRDGLVLEIGPFGAPLVRGPNVRYADIFSTEQLRERAPGHGFAPEDCPTIHYNLAEMRLRDVPERFAAVISSHCIEHQPDLVRHLNDVAAILQNGAPYVAIAPDKRYCFDHFRPVSTIVDVLSAYIDKRRTVDTRTMLSELALVTHNDTARHWAGDHGTPAAAQDHAVWRTAATSLEARGTDYVDAHVWQLTPESFACLCDDLLRMGLLGLVVESVFETPSRRHEFCALFRRHY